MLNSISVIHGKSGDVWDNPNLCEHHLEILDSKCDGICLAKE